MFWGSNGISISPATEIHNASFTDYPQNGQSVISLIAIQFLLGTMQYLPSCILTLQLRHNSILQSAIPH